MAVCKCGSYRRQLVSLDEEVGYEWACPECGAEWHQSLPAPRDLVPTDVLEVTDDDDYPRYG